MMNMLVSYYFKKIFYLIVLILNLILGLEAKKIYEEALIFIKKIIDEKLFTAKGIVGIYPGIYFLFILA